MSYLSDLRKDNEILKDYSDDEILSILPKIDEERFQGLSPEEVKLVATNDEWQITKGLKAGVDQVQALGGGAIALAGDALGSETLKQEGLDIYTNNMREASLRQGNVAGFTDIGGIEDTFDWAGYTLGNMVPSLASVIGTGGIGGAIAQVGGKKLVNKLVTSQVERGVSLEAAKKVASAELAKRISTGQAAGAYAGSTGLMSGSIYGETGDAGVSFTHGLIGGAFDAIPAFRLLKQTGLGQEAKQAVVNSVKAEMAKQGVLEGSTELLQSMTEQHAKYWVENNGASLLANLGEVNTKELIDNFAAGALGGSAAAGPIAYLGKNRTAPEEQTQESSEQEAENTEQQDSSPTDQSPPSPEFQIPRVSQEQYYNAIEMPVSLRTAEENQLISEYQAQNIAPTPSPMETAQIRMAQAGDEAAAAGGDALDQATAKGQAQESAIPLAVREEKKLAGERTSSRDMTGIDGMIISARRLGFYEEEVRLNNAKSQFESAIIARESGDIARADRLQRSADAIVQDVIAVTEPLARDAYSQDSSTNFPVSYTYQGDITGGEVTPTTNSQQQGAVFDGSPVPKIENGQRASLENVQPGQPLANGVILGNEPDYSVQARQNQELAAEQREADNFNAFYGPSNPQSEPALEGQYFADGEMEAASRIRAGIPTQPALENNSFRQLETDNAIYARPEQEEAATQSNVPDGIGENIINRMADLPTAIEHKPTISTNDFRQLQSMYKSIAKKPASKRTEEEKATVKVYQQAKKGEIIVSDSAPIAYTASVEQQQAPIEEQQETDVNIPVGVNTESQQAIEAIEAENGDTEQDNREQSNPPKYSLNNREEKTGVSVSAAQEVANEFMESYNGNIPLRVRIAETQEELYGREASEDRVGRIEGAYHPRDGVLTLTNLRDSSRSNIRKNLRHEVLGYYGLNTFKPEDKRAILDKIIASKQQKGLRSTWTKVEKKYADKTQDIQAEEVFASLAENTSSVPVRLLDEVLSLVNKALRNAGIAREPISRSELRKLVYTISTEIRSGDRVQQNFPQTNDALFSQASSDNNSDITQTTSPDQDSSTTLGFDTVESTAAKLGRRLKLRGVKITVVDTQESLPDVIKQQYADEGITGGVNAVYHNKNIYIVADQMYSVAEVEDAVLHETAHFGGESLLGSGLNKAYQKLYLKLGGTKGLKKKAKAYGFDMDHYFELADQQVASGEMSVGQRSEFLVDEFLAHVSGNQTYNSLPARIKTAVQEFIGRVRDVLRKLGAVELAEVSDSDVSYLLKRLRKAASGEIKYADRPHFLSATDADIHDIVQNHVDEDIELEVEREAMLSRVPSDASIIETDGDGIGDAETIGEMNSNAKQYARDHFVGSAVTNKESGHEIIISMAGVKHTLQRAMPALLKSVAVTPDILKEGVYLGKKPPKDGQKDVKAVHYYGAKVLVDEVIHDIVAVVKERNDGKRYYDHNIETTSGAIQRTGSNSVEITPTKSNSSIDSRKTPNTDKAKFSHSATSEQTTESDGTGMGASLNSMKSTFIRRIADKFQPLKEVQKSITDSGREISEEADAYQYEELFHGKAEEDLREMTDNFVEPLAKQMAEFDITQSDLDAYLYARHAPERNAHIASINPEMPEGGSGMSDKQAADIMRDVQSSGKESKYEQLASTIYDMTQAQRNVVRDNGLEDANIIDAWESKYEFYVPLKGYAANETESGRPSTGKGFSIGGKESKRALGRKSKADSPSAQVLQDLTEKLIRKRKNEVALSFLKLAEDHPDANTWSIYTDSNPEKNRTSKQVKDPETGEMKTVVTEQAVPMAMFSDRYFTAKRDGKTYYIKIEDPLLMNAMKNIGPENNSFIVKTLGKVIRFMSALNTSYNPEFALSNFPRDLQTAILNLEAEQSRDDGKVKGKKIAAQTVKDVPTAMKAVYRGLRGRPDMSNEWDVWFDEFLKSGAKTGYFDMKDLNEQQETVKTLVDIAKGGPKGKALQWGRATAKFVDDANSAVENAVRLAAYVNARKAGISEQKAASLVKNMTVNFNRRGELGTLINSLYMFANASIQGTMNFTRTMTGLNGEKGDPVWSRLNTAQKISFGMMAGAYALGMLNRSVAGEDDDGENFYDKIPAHDKERNIIIMKSFYGGKEGEYHKIPLAYGYNIFHVFGTSVEAVLGGGRPIGEEMARVGLAAAGSFSPIGFQHSDDAATMALKNVTPTLLKPIVDLTANENFMGSAIRNENSPFGVPKPDSSLARRSTPEGYKQIAEFLNEISGGSYYQSGYIDINPDSMRYLVGYFTGAAGNFAVNKVPDNITRYVNDVELETHRTVFLGRANGKVLPYADVDKFYKRRDEVAQIEAEMKSLSGSERYKFLKENRSKLQLRAKIKSTEKMLKALRGKRNAIYTADLTLKERDLKLKSVEKQMKALIDRINKEYTQASK